MYSIACRDKNHTPNPAVSARGVMKDWRVINKWWDQVKVAPLANKIMVLSKGTLQGLSGMIPTGGHTIPTLTSGLIDTWTHVQNRPAKNMTSENTNHTIPSFTQSWVRGICHPLDSVRTSANQPIIHITRPTRLNTAGQIKLNLENTTNLDRRLPTHIAV